MKFGEGFFGKTPEKKTEKILPEAIRYELANSGAKLSTESVEILNNNHFTKEASYLMTKLLEANERDRFEYLHQLVEAYSHSGTENTTIQLITKQFLKHITNEKQVDAMKLAQLSRQGFGYWQEQYRNKAQELGSKSEDVFLLANSTIIGLESIVQEFSKKQKSFGIVFPNNITGGNTVVGYEYIFENGAYAPGLIDRNKNHFTKSIVLDDVENTGETRKVIEEKWSETLGGSVEYVTIAKS